ncbi:MAG: phosphoketolase family protein [Clostridia bacterium]|nr:phosphoketolase family protein [Clostridia bacterium]
MKEIIIEKQPITQSYLEKLDQYFRAANYLSATQLYLLNNPLLERPLKKSDIKKKIVGHWGTVPGQNFIYTHLNRIIKKYDLNMMLISGPGHGGNFFVANSYLEGYYSEVYPDITQDREGLKKLNKQFSFPKGIGSHVSPETPGSIHEGGELGYSLAHAFGAVFDNPDLTVACIVGDGEAETGPLATSWQSNKFLNPQTDGVVIPILHLNGYKINNPTVLARISNEELTKYFEGMGWKPYFVEGNEPMPMHKLMAETLDNVMEDITLIKLKAKINKSSSRPIWPMIVLRTPKGWTGPKEVDGVKIEDNYMAHQVPITMDKPNHLKLLEDWLKSYKPNELFDKNGKLKASIRSIVPQKGSRISENLHANGGILLKELELPDFRDYKVDFDAPGTILAQDTKILGTFIRDVIKLNPNNFRLFSPDETKSNRLYPTFEASNKNFNANLLKTDDHISADGRIMDCYLSEHMCEGWLEGYLLTGRHGSFSSYESFVNVVDSMISQHAKWLKVCSEIDWRADIASLNLLITSNVWQQDHNGFSHQDPGVIDHLANKNSNVVRIYLPADANCLLSCYDHCIRTKNYVNAIVASKHPSYQWLTMPQAIEHCEKGLSEWKWASTCGKKKPDVVIVGCGDTPTLETLACTTILKEKCPKLKIKYINVVDVMKLAHPDHHPHGITDKEYDELFTTDCPIIFAYHGYATLIHELTWFRKNQNIHVFGYSEEGAITTAFDMRVLNKIDRFNLTKATLTAINAKKYKEIIDEMDKKLEEHHKYIEKYGEDLPEIKNWKFN